MSAGFRIGIDLGGTKIEGAAIDARGSARFRHRVATPAQDYRATIDAIIALVSTSKKSGQRRRSGSASRAPSLLPPASSRTPTPLG